MIKLTNLRELEKIFRKMIAKQSQLPLDKVLNALSIRGQDLTKYLSSSEIVSIDTDDILIIFELFNDTDSSNNVDEIEDDDTITRYCAFKLKVIIYGKNSSTLAHILTSRLRTQKVIYDLQEQGAYLGVISNCESINEIINDTTWHRTDFTISVSCAMTIEQIDTFIDYTKTNIISAEEYSDLHDVYVLIDNEENTLLDISEKVLFTESI